MAGFMDLLDQAGTITIDVWRRGDEYWTGARGGKIIITAFPVARSGFGIQVMCFSRD